MFLILLPLVFLFPLLYLHLSPFLPSFPSFISHFLSLTILLLPTFLIIVFNLLFSFCLFHSNNTKSPIALRSLSISMPNVTHKCLKINRSLQVIDPPITFLLLFLNFSQITSDICPLLWCSKTKGNILISKPTNDFLIAA